MNYYSPKRNSGDTLCNLFIVVSIIPFRRLISYHKGRVLNLSIAAFITHKFLLLLKRVEEKSVVN